MAPVYKDLYLTFLEESKQMPEETEVLNVLIHNNMVDLEQNRKPEGYNRAGEMRLIFPIRDSKTLNFYIYSYFKGNKVPEVTDKLSDILTKNGLEHDVEWNKMIWHSLSD